MSVSIGIFGDSIMKGVIYDSKKDKYVYSDESFVKTFARKTGFSIDNYSKFGCTLKKGERIIERHLVRMPKYRLIALEFGGNDCDFFWPAISENPNADHLPNTPLDLFEHLYSNIIDRLSANHYQSVLFTLPPLDPQRYFNWLSRGLNADNILKWLGDVNFIYKWQESYSNKILSLAHEKKVPLIDLREAFLKKKDYKDYLCEDGIHPNEKGHYLMFGTLCEYMNNEALSYF
jgi:acyl-CoA thioesterase-1